MFVRVKKIGAYEYLYRVENAREGGRHVQRVIKALGRRDEVEASGVIDGLIASAARHSRRSIVLSSFYRGELPELRRLSIGPDLVFGRLWAETGCRDVLKSLLADRCFSFDVERAVYLTVLHRLMISGSDRHANDWLSRGRVPGAEGLDLDHAYKAMAWLGAVDAAGRNTAEAVEEALYRHRQPLFGAVSIAFLDTTTLWFEGAGGESLGQYGHSKDYRGHLKQVVLGIVLDDADRPIASFLMPGNTADVTLLLPVVKRLRERFGIREACIVADRGMISADTIAALEAEKIQYILGVRERTSREVRTEVIKDDGLTVPLVIPRQKGETELSIRETTIAGRRYVICRNEEEAKKDAAARPNWSPVSNASWLRAIRRSSPTRASVVSCRRPKAAALSSTAPSSRPRPGSTASSCCAPTPKSLLSRSCCATAIFWPWRTPSKPQRRCSLPARSSTKPTPASAATSSAPSSPSSCARS